MNGYSLTYAAQNKTGCHWFNLSPLDSGLSALLQAPITPPPR